MGKSYRDQYATQKKAGIGEDLTIPFYKWEREGQTLIGKLIEFETVTIKVGMGPVNRYTIDTDDGPYSTILGGATDKRLHEKLRIGDLITIEYGGKQHISENRSDMNLFKISRWGHDDEKGSGAIVTAPSFTEQQPELI